MGIAVADHCLDVGRVDMSSATAFATSAALAPIRSSGAIRASFARRGAWTGLADSFQAGCLRLRMPRAAAGDAGAVLMNTAGGLACGDRLDQDLRWEEGAALTVTTPSAERVYRAIDCGAVIETRIDVASGALAEWLPQETILFDAARLTRDIVVSLAADAIFIGVEAVVLGRAAMGETMHRGALVDRWRVRRGGRLVYADALRIEGDITALMGRAALGGGARAFATILCVAPDAASRLAAVREILSPPGQAASAWDDILAVRLLAPDGATLRRALVAALSVLRDDRPLPRSWTC